jgi:MtN3 and saliva related transmembrane protein
MIRMLTSHIVDAIGAAGAIFTTLCWVPQTVKIIREREARAISLPGTTLCTLGVLLWLVYGLAILDVPLIGSSIATLVMTNFGAENPPRLIDQVSSRTGLPSRKARISSTIPPKKAR